MQVYEQLPSNCIDLDMCSVITMGALMADEDIVRGLWDNPVDHVVDGGTVNLLQDDGTEIRLTWARTEANEYGIYDVVVDTPIITLFMLQALWLCHVISGDCPELPGGKLS